MHKIDLWSDRCRYLNPNVTFTYAFAFAFTFVFLPACVMNNETVFAVLY